MRKISDFLLANPRLIGIMIIAALWLLTYCTSRDINQLKQTQVTIKDAVPCVYRKSEWVSVDKFQRDEKKYICFDMASETVPVQLTFSLYKNDEVLLHSYTRADEFMEGFNAFEIEALPGKHMIIIKYSRPSLAKVYFVVTEE
ncbi:MAG: hypothetical protein JNM55_01385 [Anaerolineales bacterium]|nr:hypothetical protein [Anaerolineales bacterium]